MVRTFGFTLGPALAAAVWTATAAPAAAAVLLVVLAAVGALAGFADLRGANPAG